MKSISYRLFRVHQKYLIWGMLLLAMYSNLPAQQQYEIKIFSYTLNETSNTFDLDVLVTKDGNAYELIRDDKFQVTETSDSHRSQLRVVHLSSLNVDNEDLVGSNKPNYKLYLKPDRLLFKDSRNYIVQLYVNGEIVEREVKTFAFPNERLLGDTSQFWNLLVGGALIVALLLLALSETVPWIKSSQFKKNYALRYGQVRLPNQRIVHPISGEPLQDQDWVVKKCELQKCMVPLDVWKKKNYQCIHYRECEGHVNIGKQQFFQQLGIFRQLNWLWFGALGGLLAWTAQELLDTYFLTDLALWVQQVSPEISTGMTAQGLLGFSLGLCLTLVMAWVDEAGQGRNFRALLFLGKIILGGIAGSLIFVLGAYFIQSLPILAGLLSWLLLGIALGAIISMASHITAYRGILGGAAAAVIAFGAYHILIEVTQSVEVPKLLGFILFGAIFGWTVIRVVKELELIELEVLAPAYRKGFKFIIDKWLRVEKDGVRIGKNMKNKVRVKWDDMEAQDYHARIFLRGAKVFIAPFKGQQIWVDGKMIHGDGEQALSGGEKIWLGRNRQTEFRYIQKFSS
ncbi:MAG: hypothetical protein AAF694_17430 [Bacteroidota bacterium]